MILVDTSVWIDFFRKIDSEIGGRLSGHLEGGEVIAVSAIFGELLQGAKNEAEEKVILEFWQSLPKIDEEDLFIEAGKLSREFKLTTKGVGLVDGYILAACKQEKLTLWTLNKKLVEVFLKL